MNLYQKGEDCDVIMKSKKKEVMLLEQFGICPHCGNLMVMLTSNFSIYGLTPHGKYPNRILKNEKDITYACECGYRAKMRWTVDGIYPENYAFLEKMEDELIQKIGNPIGYVEETL